MNNSKFGIGNSMFDIVLSAILRGHICYKQYYPSLGCNESTICKLYEI